MNKLYVVLLFLGLFSLGCENKDTENVNVTDYPDLILGHWEQISHIKEVVTKTIDVDPIFGTEETSTNSTFYTDPDLINPIFGSNSILVSDKKYSTFRYDDTCLTHLTYIHEWGVQIYNDTSYMKGPFHLSNDSLTISVSYGFPPGGYNTNVFNDEGTGGVSINIDGGFEHFFDDPSQPIFQYTHHLYDLSPVSIDITYKIQELSDTELILFREYSDTSDIIENRYFITDSSYTYHYIRIPETPISE